MAGSSFAVTGISAFQYTLNGTLVSTVTPNFVEFYNANDFNGGFVLDLSSANSVATFNSFGTPGRTVQLYSGSETNPLILAGAYTLNSFVYIGPPNVTETTPIPDTAGALQITQQAGGGTSNSLPFTITPSVSAVPAITSLSPSSITAGSGEFSLTVNGNNFVPGAQILWNGAGLSTTFVGSTQLTAPVSANLIATPGSASITVSSGGQTSSAATFLINPGSGQPGAPTGSTILPQFAFGGGWYSALYFTNSTGSAVSFVVNFISDAGTPLFVPALNGSTAQVNLPPGGTTVLEAPNSGSLMQGYAVFNLPAGVSGYGVFRQSVAGIPDQEAVVPFSSVGSTTSNLTWDETNYTTAAAIVNPSSSPSTVNLTFWDANGNLLGTSNVSLPPTGKTEANLHSLPGLASMVGQRGSAQFTVSGGTVAVLGLRFKASAFTSIPTTTGNTSPNPGPTVLPQFVFGGGWYSALYFTNLTSSFVSFSVNFLSDAGTPLAIPSLGGSSSTVNLPPNGTAIIEAPDTGSLTEGYAVFNLPSGVSGYGVFRQSVPGIADQEAAVPFSSASSTSNSLTFDETNYTTAAAIVNPSSTAATVDVTTWDGNGNAIGSSTIVLPPNGKTEADLRLLTGLGGIVGNRGDAQFSASGGNVAVLGLRFNGAAFTSIPATSISRSTSSGGMQIISGNSQTAYVNQAFGQPLVLQIVDGNGNPVSGQTVAWTINQGSASLSQLSTVTDANGQSSNNVTAGSITGTVVITASAASLSVQFSLTITSGGSGAPTITSLSPSSALAGGAAFTLTVNGTGFASNSIVGFNNAAVPTTFINVTQLTASVPANLISTPGTVPISVVNPGPPAANSAPASFSITTSSFEFGASQIVRK